MDQINEKIYIDRDYIAGLLKFYLGRLSVKDISNLKDSDEDRYYGILIDRAFDNFHIGEIYYILGDFQKARCHFSKVCKYTLEYWDYDPWEYSHLAQIPSAARLIDSAIISREIDIRKKCAERILNNIKFINDKKGDSCVYESIALSYYIAQEKASALPYISEIERTEIKESQDNNLSGDGKFIGRSKMIDGLLKKDKGKLLEGIHRALEKYNRVNRRNSIPLCISALIYLILARDNDIIISIDDIPKKLRRPIFRFFEEP